jgi:hypothetical protein
MTNPNSEIIINHYPDMITINFKNKDHLSPALQYLLKMQINSEFNHIGVDETEEGITYIKLTKGNPL